MELPSTSIEGASSSQSEPVPFTNIISGLRKEEVSRLLFTALHLASQGHMDIISTPGEINSMEVVLRSTTER
ncbi:hypothetical protein J437_LFUL007521 [Ladona fulva]|uniref:Uncharacterized protein n=1 Tax=Ladona fulva TaxID=123851 RepID=A0A8K0K669_LADFU|nr:hypothetical protein J437_LFUL007521 [Ladona fulva]